jgi:hypothetical protein
LIASNKIFGQACEDLDKHNKSIREVIYNVQKLSRYVLDFIRKNRDFESFNQSKNFLIHKKSEILSFGDYEILKIIKKATYFTGARTESILSFDPKDVLFDLEDIKDIVNFYIEFNAYVIQTNKNLKEVLDENKEYIDILKEIP